MAPWEHSVTCSNLRDQEYVPGSVQAPSFTPQPCAQVGFTAPAAPALGSREDTFELFILSLLTCQPLCSTDSTTAALDTREAERQGPEEGRGAPRGMACLFGADRRQRTIPYNGSRQEPREESHPPPVTPPSLVHLSPRLLPHKEVCRALPDASHPAQKRGTGAPAFQPLLSSDKSLPPLPARARL